jgi:hypothetical protein
MQLLVLQAHQKCFKAALCCGLIMMTENKKKHAAVQLIRIAAAGPSASHQPSNKGFGQAAGLFMLINTQT